MRLHIKYTLCVRCKKEMLEQLDQLGLHYGEVEKGELEITEDISYKQLDVLKKGLTSSGLELIDDKKAMLVREIKNIIINSIRNTEFQLKTNLSAHLSETLHYDYSYISSLYKEITGTTIEQFMIYQKIERVKELLTYDDLNLTEISYMLNYSSVAHLSNQFKKVTGVTPTIFKYIINRSNIIQDMV